MKEPTFNGRELLPLSVMEAAHAGDAMAISQTDFKTKSHLIWTTFIPS